MDRIGSNSYESSRDMSSDERFDNIGDKRRPAKKSEYPSQDSKLPAASTVAPLTSSSNTPPAALLQACEWQSDDMTELDRPDVALTSRHPFSEIPIRFITVYQVLLDVDANAASNHKRIRSQKRQQSKVTEAIKFLKRQRSLGKSLEATTEYQLLRGSRSEKSSLEVQLPAASAFRAMLYPPTGGVRDTRTGLYAELRKVTIEGKPVFVLCFPGTGAARNRDTQWKANLKQAFGAAGIPRLYTQSLALAKELKTALNEKEYELQVAGHSMGGGIANFIGLALNIDSYCFNAAALGGTCLNQLDIDGCLTAERIERQNHVTLKGDYASNRKLSTAIGLLSPSGQRPQQVGNVYEGNADDEDYPQAFFPLDRHPLDAMEDMMYAQKMSLWRNTRKSATTTATPKASSTSSTSAVAKPQVTPEATQSKNSASEATDDGSERS